MNEFYCEQCGSCFTRQEHLARHARTHTKEKPHACFDCGKKFSRLDALRRHTASHTARETAALARACRQCAASRVRCTRELPCRRCSEKSLPCQYPQSRKRGKVTARLHESPTGGEEFAGPSDVTAGDANVFPTTHAIEQIGGSWSTANDFSQFDHIEYAACGEEQTSIMSSMNWLPPAAPMAMDLNWTTLDTGISVGSLSDELGLSSVGNTIIDTGTCNQADRPPPLRHNETSLPPNEGRDAAQRDTEGPSVEESLPSPQSPDTTATGKATLYVDGALTRLPFKGRCIESFEAELDNSIGIEEKGPRYGGVNDPTSCGTESPDATSAASSHLGGDVLKGYLSADAFSNLVHQLHSLLVLRDLDVSEGTLPMLGYMRAFLRLYFRRFHPAWPFLPPALSYYEEPCRWLLLLAVTAVGSKYAPGQQCAVYSTLLCDLLAKSAPHLLKDVQTRTPEELVGDAAQEGSDLPTIQAAILDIICKSHNFRTNSRKEAFSQLFMIAETCRDMGMLEISDTLNTDRLPDDMLRDWTGRETRIRTGLMIWVLDSTIAFELSRRPLFCLDDASGLLPCRASLWENPSAENIIASERYSVTIPKALEILYLEKGLPPNLDELGTNVLICAIYRRTKEAFNQYQKPLASWTPTAHVQHWQSTGYRPHEETWPPTLPILSKWRNSACDCLDILHWNANGTIAKAGGWEHPAVLNLHLSRLIILTPMQDLQRIAASDSVHGDYEEKARNRIKEWVFNDQHKARLSVVHAGALLWHARRYRTGSFLEPFGVFMATMVIWAYSSTLQLLNHQQGQPMSSQASRNRVSEEELDPAFLHLDRPLDDELVQEFILSGFSMAGHISGVGDIRKADAPRKILIMGSRLLASLRPGGKLGHEGLSSCGADVERSGVWGIEKVYIERLERLKASMASK